MNNAAELDKGDANPYNSKKTWDGTTKEVERGLQGANDSLAYVTPKKENVAISTPEGMVPLDGNSSATPQADETEDTQVYNKVDYKKRYDDLKKHYDSKLNEWKSTEQSLKADIATTQPKFTAPKTPEDLATFKEQYPDVFDVIETVAHSRAEEQVQDLTSKVNQLTEREQKIASKEAEQELLNLHPDFRTIRDDTAFHDWAKAQPEVIQEWVYNNNNDVTLASRAIDLYKRDSGLNTESTQESTQVSPTQTSALQDSRGSAADAVQVSKATAGLPTNSGPKIWSRAEIAALPPHEFERLQPEIDKAFVEGRIAA